MRKIFSKALLAVYLIILVWLLLFKFAFYISPILHLHHRSLNLIPFAAPSILNGKINYGEMIWNCIFFIPFGLLLNVNFKKTGFLSKLLFILAFSFSIELVQYIFAIGASDLTDIITNTVGGFFGLVLYDLSSIFIKTEKLDNVVISVGVILLLIFIAFRLRVTMDFRDKSTRNRSSSEKANRQK